MHAIAAAGGHNAGQFILILLPEYSKWGWHSTQLLTHSAQANMVSIHLCMPALQQEVMMLANSYRLQAAGWHVTVQQLLTHGAQANMVSIQTSRPFSSVNLNSSSTCTRGHKARHVTCY
jgi:hypothetical protein